jgi:hypothetical protein
MLTGIMFVVMNEWNVNLRVLDEMFPYRTALYWNMEEQKYPDNWEERFYVEGYGCEWFFKNFYFKIQKYDIL